MPDDRENRVAADKASLAGPRLSFGRRLERGAGGTDRLDARLWQSEPATGQSKHADSKADSRRTSRAAVRRIGWLSRMRGEQVRECLVWDESETGMRIVVNAPDEIPDTFYVYTSLDSASRRQCRAIWRSDGQIGVEFLA